MPLRDEVVPGRSVAAPGAGYLVPARHAAAVARWLDVHGVAYRRIEGALPGTELEAFRADAWRPAAASSEGRQRLEVDGAWAAETRDLGAGALFVPIAQPRARLAMAILEPQAPDSMLAWGEFNNAFERKEYMEAYVAEDVARGMLRDPAVRAAFESRLAEDPAFTASPQARLEWFHRRHASWDERLGLYPVFRAAIAPR